MAYIRGEAREQTTMFPVTLDELIPEDHMCRVIEAFVDRLDLAKLSFVRAEPADTGRPGYDPRDLLKLYLYGYLQQVRSSRRVHHQAMTDAGAELVRLARSVGLVRGETVAVDGSKFRAVSSAKSVRERDAVKRYLEQLDAADEQDEVVIDSSAVQAALEKLKSDPEPEARLMRLANGFAPAYNVQTAVDTEHALIVAQKVTDEATDNRSLLPMAEAAQQAVGNPDSLNVVADAGYSNGEQAQLCEAQGIVPHVPANRSINSHGNGTLFDRTQFEYDEKTDTFRCPANQTLARKQVLSRKKSVLYAAAAETCCQCPLKSRCTNTSRRLVQRHVHDGALQRMQQRATPAAMRLRRSTVEHPFASLKYRIFGHPRFLLRGAVGDQLGHHGLQLETHAERAGRKPAPSGTRRIGKCHPCATTSQNKKRCSEFPNIASSTSCPCFVTDCSSGDFVY